MEKKGNVLEARELRAIIGSQILHKILQRRKVFHQTKVNECLRALKFTEAYGSLCKLDDIDKFESILQTEFDKLTKEKEEK